MYVVYGPPSIGRYHSTPELDAALTALQHLIQVQGVDGRIECEETEDVLYVGYACTGVVEYQDWLTPEGRDELLTERGL